jgi:hypothetical protein
MYRLLKARIADLRRAQARRAHAEQQFAAVHSSPFDEADLHDYLLGKEILSRLPSPWDQVARWRLEEGLSWSEIARRLHTRVGSVTVRFRRALERVCREMGLECRKVALSSDIKGGGAKKRRRTSGRRQSDEQTQGIGDERIGADDSELGGAADHPRRSQRTRGGGGGSVSSSVVSGKGCGCSGGVVPLNETELKQQLESNRLTLVNDREIRPARSTCHCSNPVDRQYDDQKWCPPRGWFERRCDDYDGGPDYDGDGTLEEPNYHQTRKRKIVVCGNGWKYVECGRWIWDNSCCGRAQPEPDCLEGISGRALECGRVTTPGSPRPVPMPEPPSEVPPEDVRPVPDPRLPRR